MTTIDRSLILALVLCATTGATSARADELSEGLRLFEAMEYQDALPHLLGWCHKRGDADQASIIQRMCQVRTTPQVLTSVLGSVSEITTKSLAELLAVDHRNRTPLVEQLSFDRVSNRRFTTPGQSG